MPPDVISVFKGIKVWQRRTERAPHKPLLLLLVLGHYANGAGRLIPFSEVDRPLQQLLREFGPPRSSHHSEYPFWRLQNDGAWELTNAELVESRKSNSDTKKSELYKHKVSGGLKEDLFDAITSSERLTKAIAMGLLRRCFPESFHQDILDSVGLSDLIEVVPRRKRAPDFRDEVLRAYEYRCAMCGFYVQMDGRPVCLEAAHIQWHMANGPDAVQNGLCLCSLHHRLLDRGALSLSDDRRILVSEAVHGTDGIGEWLLSILGRPLREPVRIDYSPRIEHLQWHRREVFRSPARAVVG